MANVRYDAFAEFIAGFWLTDVIKACLISDAYTPDPTGHRVLSDLGANRLGTDQTLTGKTNTAGKLASDAVTFAAVPAGHTARYVGLYRDTGTAGTSTLILVDDSTTGLALPIATNGGDIFLTPDPATGWLKL